MKTRRDFLRSTVLGASAAWTIPMFIDRTFAQLHEESKDLAIQPVTGKDDTILVVLQLAGGNDGLNTLVPYADDAYYRARPKIGKKAKEIIKLDDHVGLNASMPYLGSLFKEGGLGVIQGVGYPNPNRSHFVSTSIWETADPSHRANTGWLGRYFDHACQGADPTVGISFNKTQPESFGALRNPGICLHTPELYQWLHGGSDKAQAEEFFASLNQPEKTTDADDEPSGGASIGMAAGGKTGGIAGESNISFLERVALDARVSSKQILELAAKHKTKVRYDGTPIARNLNLVARMVAGGMPTRVYYVSHGGFDTHNQQVNSHDRLLGQLDSALKSFFSDLKEQGNADRVTLMTFSEFGRRVSENASAGTDHGKASCMFVAGPSIQSGLHGVYPSLTDLSEGDLRHSVDFRSVYATVLEDWLKAPSASQILGATYPKMGLVRRV
ncbi:DUF1501 domain-containing protein [Luteolibacter pohnpeiensis]|uniref:DUF1501 domain-containing protein n=1 Tax=Luteolibacter pohnpeiensis TaxID=454153 RepID=A0A934SBE2_9BACT|nr:DUF1501 domain-containing protein [Luteolibacter pohnpeiensis]MBK1883077.1 DUF1501 domain-containing protein [Luteolibacter pohnpeiensis]